MDNVTSKQADVVHTTTVSERFFEDSFSRPRGTGTLIGLDIWNALHALLNFVKMMNCDCDTFAYCRGVVDSLAIRLI
ncbi:hypothetical protein PRIPAC_74464 [Pristionchus pacificus]|uniref:Uncharacterized protein n=1 Tax=Pristionchus pacificus TaxID=54126 RepID=A0A2A6CFF9_PRIPA|nr:hypothetical protein PRIPAC_74464 [Pristionchus pacificus]|eukprot:PDM76741.1 hypothetical protein PRIPAC_42136 [Pristionchus pacificus]